ncbi:hypothetical protein ACFFU1_13185 [Algibacter miyuki]|uniref:DinB family protein n=1 Tax=Algibacter miyuki TaxID=1306933 RepID=A0ABV5H1S8_9FLAO|nr:hypothetical protein [Algibacter miyuki]MDN3666467.1 hypothetical protein [Algibacter miyuki]
MKLKLLALLLMINTVAMAQEEKLPYYEILEPAENYTAGSVAARMIDGLGFRYYWATEGLKAEDLEQKASDSGRTSGETVDHILGLSYFILNAISEEENKKANGTLSFEEQRKQTLLNFKKASDILLNTEDLSKMGASRTPFWNIINGPIADAIWHSGQVAMLRRASGNPFNSKVNLFSGKVKK